MTEEEGTSLFDPADTVFSADPGAFANFEFANGPVDFRLSERLVFA